MRTSANLNRLKKNADEFGIATELAWLMETQPLWDRVRLYCMDRNKEAVSSFLPEPPPIDDLRAALLTLAATLPQ